MKFIPCILTILAPCRTFAQSPYTSLQIPQQIQYQGRISQSGASWSGEGFFVFALIEEGTVLWNNFDGSWSPGNPSAVPPVPDTFPSNPATTVLADKFTTAPVTGGTFSVRLGSDAAGRNRSIAPTVFFNPNTNTVRANVKLAVWFSADSQTFTRLSPDVSLASVPYAMVAGIAETIKERGVGSDQLADHTITSSKLAPPGPGNGQLSIAGNYIAPESISDVQIGPGAVGSSELKSLKIDISLPADKTATSSTEVPIASVGLAKSARPVLVSLMAGPPDTGNPSYVGFDSVSGDAIYGEIRIYRSTNPSVLQTLISTQLFGSEPGSGVNADFSLALPPASFCTIDTASEGFCFYVATIRVREPYTNPVSARNVRLVAREL